MNNSNTLRTIWGVAIVILGAGFLFNTLGILSFAGIAATYWPILIIVLGLGIIINKPANYVVPIFIVLVGMLFQLDRFGLINVNVFQIVWPLIIITIGLSILFNRSKKQSKGVNENSSTNLFTALSGIQNRVTSDNYQGGEATAILGGITLDLREAKIKDSANLNLLTIMGGVELRVPNTWNVNVKGTPILGGWENGATKPTSEKAPTLNIDAMCVMGGIEIKN